MYKLHIPFGQTKPSSVNRLSDGASFLLLPDNTDYQAFKKEVLAGAELQDSDGNVMTQIEADAFIATLP